MALLSASVAADEGTKQQQNTSNAQTRASLDVGAAGGGGPWALGHIMTCILWHYIIFDPPKLLHL